MQEIELTWNQVARIWWAAFWRWLIWANLTVGAAVGLIGIGLWAIGIHFVPLSPWMTNCIILLSIPAGFMALRLALKAPYKGFRVAIISTAPAMVREI
jgi:hypothetical protein